MKIDGSSIAVINDFIHIESTITNNLSLCDDISKCIAKATGAMTKLCDLVWENSCLITKTNVLVYQTCIINTFLYTRKKQSKRRC